MRVTLVVAICVVLHLLGAAANGLALEPHPAVADPEANTATIRVDTSHVIKSFDPDVALGPDVGDQRRRYLGRPADHGRE